MKACIPNTRHVISQYYIISRVKELLNKHQKRPDFSRNNAYEKLESIVLEVDLNTFEDKLQEFLNMIKFDSFAENEVGHIFEKDK